MLNGSSDVTMARVRRRRAAVWCIVRDPVALADLEADEVVLATKPAE
jgi:hypothetical protein